MRSFPQFFPHRTHARRSGPESANPDFDAPSVRIRLNGADVWAYEYATVAEADEVASRVPGLLRVTLWISTVTALQRQKSGPMRSGSVVGCEATFRSGDSFQNESSE